MKRRTLALVLFAFGVRVAAIAAFGFERVEFGDAQDYLDTAAALCASGSYPDHGNLPFFRAPALPVFVAAVTACAPGRVAAVKVALAAVDSLTVAVVAVLAFVVLRSERAALLAGAAAALWPLFVAGVTDVRSEPLFLFFLWSAVALLALLDDRARREPSPPAARLLALAALAGASLALAALTRPLALAFLPLFLAATWRRRRAAALLLVGFAVTLAPWTLRNYARFGELMLVNDAGGYNLWRGMHPEMARIYALDDRAEYRRAARAFEEEVAVSARAENRTAADWRRAARAEIARDPRAAARFAAKKALLYWRPWLNPQEHSTPVVVASALLFVPLDLLAALGLARLARERRALVLWAAAFLVVGWLGHVPYQVVMRFRYPVTDPLLLVAAASFVAGRGAPAPDDDPLRRA